VFALALLGSLTLPLPLPLLGQVGGGWVPGMKMGAGWSGVVPEAVLGAGFFHFVGSSRIGVYGHAMMPHDSRVRDPYFESDLTVAEVEALPSDQRIPISVREEFRVLGGGVMWAVSRESALGAGGGMVRRVVLREYGDDSDAPRNPSGFFWVEDEEETGWEPNWNLMALFRGGQNIAFTAGFDYQPRSITLGLYLLFGR